MRHEPGERIASRRPRLEYLFDQGQHRVLIEAIPAQLRVVPAPQLELTASNCLPHVDARVGEPPEMVFRQLWVHEVESFIPPVEALSDERAKHPVFLVRAVKESANMAVLAESATGTANGVAVRSHVSPPAAIGICQ